MKKIFLFCILLFVFGCQESAKEQAERKQWIEDHKGIYSDGRYTYGTLDQLKYKGHDYIVFHESLEHDPDCACKNAKD